MDRRPQEDHADLGIVDGDNTEILKKRKAPAATEALQKFDHQTHHSKET